MYRCFSLFHWCSHQLKESLQTDHFPWIGLKICLLTVPLEKKNTLAPTVAFLGTADNQDCRETTHWEDTTLLIHLTTKEEWSCLMTSKASTNSVIQLWSQDNQKVHSSLAETTHSIAHHLVSEEVDSAEVLVEASGVLEGTASSDQW